MPHQAVSGLRVPRCSAVNADDDWIDDEERLEQESKNYTNRRARTNAFDVRYAGDVVPKDDRWDLCVLARNDVKKGLSRVGESGSVLRPPQFDQAGNSANLAVSVLTE